MYCIHFVSGATEEQKQAIVSALKADSRLKVVEEGACVKIQAVSAGLEISGVHGLCHGKPGFYGVSNLNEY